VPPVRIDLRKGKGAAYRQDIGRVVYEALASVGVPKGDRFQVVGEYEADNFLYDPDYLGIHRTDDLVMIQITWNEGRTVEQKKAHYKAIVDGPAAKPGIWPEDLNQPHRGQEGELVPRPWRRAVCLAQPGAEKPSTGDALAEVPFASSATLTGERRGHMAPF
jgi:hypothetical protein